MKRLASVGIILVLAVAVFPPLAEAALEPTYSSEKPLYAFVVVNEAATKVLKLVFDESQGTDKGYDTIYADLDFNGNLTDDAPIQGTIEGEEGSAFRPLGTLVTAFVQGSFPPIEVPVPYNEKAEGIENPCQLVISYTGYGFGEGIDHTFSLNARIRLRGEEAVWEYSWLKTFQPVAKPEGAVATSVVGEPSLFMSVMPGRKKEGYTTIAAALMADMQPMVCTRDNKPITPLIQIKDKHGTVLPSEDVTSDKSGLGPPGMVECSVAMTKGRHSLEVSLDTGPLAGMLTTTMPWGCGVEVSKEPVYSSEKPLYAAVAVDEAASKILTLVFDESEGTGKGYDTIYADLNFDGDLTDDQAIKGTFTGDENLPGSSFPVIDVPVPYNEKARDIDKPCQLDVMCYQFRQDEQAQQHFQLSAEIKLSDEAEEWQYSLYALLSPAEKPEGAIVATFGGKPSLQLFLAPSDAAEGNVGIGAMVMAGMGPLSCTKDDQPVMAHLKVANERGVTIHSQHVDADKLRPG